MESKNNTKIILATVIITLIVIGVGFGTYKLFIEKNVSKTTVTESDYTCPMHQQISSDHPGQCPICGMDLVKRSSLKGTENQNSKDSTGVTLHQVKLSPSQQVLANVQTVKVKKMQFSGEKTFNGYVKLSEKGFAHISTRLPGKIQQMYVNFEGQYVSKGQAVFEIYSPDLIAAQKDYLLSLDNYEQIKKSGSQFATGQALSLFESSVSRLKSFEMTDSQMQELERTRKVRQTMTHYSPYSGIITKKYVHVGHWASGGEDIYDIADMSSIWVIANVYEADMQYIKTGQQVEISSGAYPNETFGAKVSYINPTFSADSRTLEVRIDVSNNGGKLKPDMYVKVKINTYVDLTVSVPKNAVIRTGERNIVYVQKEIGVYIPREVSIGYEKEGYYAVTQGLNEGEIVVSAGGFLIDSETQIQEGENKQQNMEGMDMKNDNPKINKDQDIMKDMENKK